MQSVLLSRRDIDFLLFEWLGVDELTKQERFAEHSRETFEALLDLCEQLATRYFATHNKKSDTNEPSFDGQTVTMIPEVKEAWIAFAQADLLAIAMDGGSVAHNCPPRCPSRFRVVFSCQREHRGLLVPHDGNANLLARFGTNDQVELIRQANAVGPVFRHHGALGDAGRLIAG